MSSYFGVLAREHVPLSMRDWRCKDNAQIKERIWNEMQEGFTIPIEQKHDCLMRVGEAARLFRHEIYNDLLKDIINEPIALKRPACILKYYTSITEEYWIAFVEYRRTEMFKQTSEHGKSNIGKVCTNLERAEMDIESLIKKRLDSFILLVIPNFAIIF